MKSVSLSISVLHIGRFEFSDKTPKSLISRPEDSYRLWCVITSDLRPSWPRWAVASEERGKGKLPVTFTLTLKRLC
jgi:hypothetical protein